MKSKKVILIVIISIILIISGVFFVYRKYTIPKTTQTKKVAVKKDTKVSIPEKTLEEPIVPREIEGVPVLMYHSIAIEKGNPIRLPKETLEEQMAYLKENDYITLTLDELYSYYEKKLTVPDKAVVLTFDDGYEDNYTNMYPILKKYGFKATIFVITDTIDKDPQYLTSAQLKEMNKNGIDIESHTVTHRDLNTLSNDEQLKELQNSKSTLEKTLNKKINFVAYPSGKYNDYTITAAENAGYIMGFTTDGRWSYQDKGLLKLDRVYISSFFSMDTFKERITNPNYTTNFVEGIEDKYKQGYDEFNNKNYAEAIKTEQSVISMDAQFYRAYSVKGIALCFSGDYENGMKDIDKALSIDPYFGYGRFNKALAYELYGHYDEAIQWYNNALKVEKYVWSYYGIASIYGRKGDIANTTKYLNMAIDMDPGVKSLAKEEKDFDNVRKYPEFQQLIKE